MSILAVPTADDPFYTQVTDLDGTDYILEFRYSQREDAWYFSVSLNDETRLVSGVKIVCDVNLLGRFSDTRLPPGILMAIANEQDDNVPGMGELGIGKRVTLTYLDASELATP